MAKNKKTKKMSTKQFIAQQKFSIFFITIVIAGLGGVIGYVAFSSAPDPDTLSSLTTDIADVDNNSGDATDSDTDDDLIIDPGSITAYDVSNQDVAVEADSL